MASNNLRSRLDRLEGDRGIRPEALSEITYERERGEAVPAWVTAEEIRYYDACEEFCRKALEVSGGVRGLEL